jgi:peptidyl-tRNA hydrolase
MIPVVGISMTKRIKILVRRNLKMTCGKSRAQCVHAAIGLYKLCPMEHWSCVTLDVSDAKFEEAKARLSERLPESDLSAPFYVVKDAGYTEVPAGSETALAFYEDDPRE